MTSRHQIDCIVKDDRYDKYERIQRVGGKNPDGSRWNMSLDDAIRHIENKTYAFYVNVENDQVNVIVSSRNGKKYLKTVSDGDEPNNLLSLDRCPV